MDRSDLSRYRGLEKDVHRRVDKESKLAEIKAVAEQRYGVKEWEKSPFGSWHPLGTMAKVEILTEKG